MSLLNHTTDTSLIFQKMRETFQHRQKLVNDPGNGVDILSTFPRFLDTKGLVDQDFTLLFDDETSSRLLQKWDVFFKPNIIKEASQLTSTPELRRLVRSAESPPESDLDEATTYNPEMASLLLLLHLLPPPPGGPKSPKVSAWDAVERLVVFHKSCCSLEEHLRNRQGRQPYLLAVGRQKSKIDSFYIVMDKHLIPCQANRSLGAFDELFKAHFVFNVSYDVALVNFYTFLQTAVYNIDVGKMKETPRVRELRARLLNHTVVAFFEPPPNPALFFNYKGTYSIVLSAVVDARYRFRVVDIGGYGRTSDGGTLASSKFGKALQNGRLDLPEDRLLPEAEHLGCQPHVFVASNLGSESLCQG
ncbi:hypothetical protein AAFF_G00122490 [Aldrovandia affinis]|uniref:DDE Tnp4 domain-containing protein n=1 Tax=Aldrovandia affinis TaxID=143900 RepID=A0AAD7RRW6_9TELE|nr:hypothetical protein AAFF_G00122490 [Aldrovandia affinis]